MGTTIAHAPALLLSVLASNSPLRATVMAMARAAAPEAPRITPARGPPLWNDCGAQDPG